MFCKKLKLLQRLEVGYHICEDVSNVYILRQLEHLKELRLAITRKDKKRLDYDFDMLPELQIYSSYTFEYPSRNYEPEISLQLYRCNFDLLCKNLPKSYALEECYADFYIGNDM